jgi:hypothetical protein
MNGFQVCKALQSIPQLRQLPVVLMSAKGDKIRGQFMQQSGAVDAITKPFDPRALLAVVESALRKPTRTNPSPAQRAPEDSAADLTRIAKLKGAEREAEVSTHFVTALVQILQPTFARSGPIADARALTDLLRRVLNAEQLKNLAGLLSLLDTSPAGTPVLSGDLSFISIAEVLQLLELQRQTGTLSIRFGNQDITVYLANGKIDLVKATNLPLSFRLGRFLVEDAVLSRDELAQQLSAAGPGTRLFGEELVGAGYATPEAIAVALKRQSSELVYEAVRWKGGMFSFSAGETCVEATLAELGLAPGSLLMEGFRRIDEWQLIEGTFQFDDVLSPDRSMIDRMRDRSELTTQEELVLAAIDTKRTVRQIVDDVDASTFDVCKVLYQFIKSGLVRRKST